ncbi:MAG TPA: hypothetical protein DGB72_08175 [Gemmatimonadetes bacterium]|nr:hypothetical protein [Gemmatimonadota bacterium]
MKKHSSLARSTTSGERTAYTPIHGVEATPGNDVRLRLSDKGAVDLARGLVCGRDSWKERSGR